MKIKNKRDRAIALTEPVQVHRFDSQKQLARYTIDTDKVFPRRFITDGSPLKLLLAEILYQRRRGGE